MGVRSWILFHQHITSHQNQPAVWQTMSSVLSSVLSLAGLVLGVCSVSHCLQSPHIAPLTLTGSGLWASATFLVSRISGRLNEEDKGNKRSCLILDSVTTALALVLSIVSILISSLTVTTLYLFNGEESCHWCKIHSGLMFGQITCGSAYILLILLEWIYTIRKNAAQKKIKK